MNFLKDTVNYIISSKSQRFLDFQIVLDNEEYWQVECHIIKRREGCKKYTSYPMKSSHFIRWIDLGIDFWLQFPKSKFPSDPDEVRFININYPIDLLITVFSVKSFIQRKKIQ